MDIDFKDLLNLLTKLRVDRAKGIAPHKPLLLLVIIELARSGELKEPLLRLTPELAFRFSVYWSIVAHRRSQRPDVRLPFHHMGSSKLWTPLTSEGSESAHCQWALERVPVKGASKGTNLGHRINIRVKWYPLAYSFSAADPVGALVPFEVF